MSLIDTINNREKAVVTWIFIFLVWALTKKDVRNSFTNIMKMMFLTKLSLIYFGTIIYITLIIFILDKINIWQPLLIKDAIFWVLGTCFILILNINKVTQESNYFRRVLFDSFKLTIVLEFILSLYPYSFLIEMFLMPFLFFIFGLNAISKMKKEYLPVKKLTDWILAIIGIYTIIFALSQLVSNYNSIATTYNIRVIILSPILTTTYIPFLYVIALFMAYELLFVRLNFLIKDNKKLVKFTKEKIFFLCQFNLGKLNKFVKLNNTNFLKLADKSDVLKMVKEFQENEH